MLFLSLSIWACNNKPEVKEAERNAEAREDSAKYAEAVRLQSLISFAVEADVETDNVLADSLDDSADDPAIWYNTAKPELSLILGTNKKAGLYAFDLSGKTKNFIPAGKINNVDLRDGFNFKDKEYVLVAGSNRSLNAISLFLIDKDSAMLTDTIANIPSGVSEVYGICLYKNAKTKAFYVFVNGKEGDFEQWEINAENTKGLNFKMVRKFSVSSQPEALAADDATNTLYLGVEESGIFKMNALPDADTTMTRLAQSDTSSNKNIAYDIEGISVFEYNNQKYLMASIQGNFSYAIYKLGNVDSYLGSFKIVNGSFDGVEETDGLDVLSVGNLPNFPGGIAVFQDGFNHDGKQLKSQNFKYLSLDKLKDLLK